MRLRVRWHAARHSDFVMWVAGSQNPMQSLSVLPPPPGVLGLVSLGLPGDSARLPLPCLGTPPPDETTGGTGGDSGAMLGT
jgi:hypothetical protein